MHDITTPEQEEIIDLAHLDNSPTSVVFGDIDAPLVELSVVSTRQQEGEHRVVLDAEQRSAISALLAQAPALVQYGYLAHTPVYRLSFASGVAAKMDKLMQAQSGGLRASALDQRGKILGNGILHPTTGLRAVAATAAVWHMLAMITAQVHLSEITTRLAQIERGIGEIRAWLEADHISTVETSLRYVREASMALEQGKLSETERNHIADQLEYIWRECGQVSRTLLAMMARAPVDTATLNLSAWYQLDASSSLVSEAITIYERRAHAYLLATYVRCVTVALRTLLNLDAGVSEHRLDELRSDLADERDNFKLFYSTFKRHIYENLSATFNRQTTINVARRRVLTTIRAAQHRLTTFGNDTEQMHNRLRVRITPQHIPTPDAMMLIVTLDAHGQVTEAYYVEERVQTSASLHLTSKASDINVI